MKKYYFVELRAHSFSKTYIVSRCELHVALCLIRTSNMGRQPTLADWLMASEHFCYSCYNALCGFCSWELLGYLAK